ncbi:MAG: hypothetical protein V3V31_00020 [Methylococcales bacterium]
MALVVADAGPLIALGKIDQLSILQYFFTEITITEAVRAECFVNNGLDAQRIKKCIEQGWIKTVVNPELVNIHSRSLGLGEKTSIEFALQVNEPVLLILDDALARNKANAFDMAIVGTVMLIFNAEQKQYLNNADALVKILIKSGYRISDRVVLSVKQQLNIKR